METGLLWFDDSRVPVGVKVDNAVRRYRERFGHSPNVCYVHPKILADEPGLVARVPVIARKAIQPNYFWVCVKLLESP